MKKYSSEVSKNSKVRQTILKILRKCYGDISCSFQRENLMTFFNILKIVPYFGFRKNENFSYKYATLIILSRELSIIFSRHIRNLVILQKTKLIFQKQSNSFKSLYIAIDMLFTIKDLFRPLIFCHELLESLNNSMAGLCTPKNNSDMFNV